MVSIRATVNKISEHFGGYFKINVNGKINVAGPFGDDDPWRGIFNVATKAEEEELLKSDPAIAAGRMDYEIHPWWSAKGISFK